MATTKQINMGEVAPWLRKEITKAIATLGAVTNSGSLRAVEDAERTLLAAAEPLTGLKSREADELWKLIGKARGIAHQAVLSTRLADLENRFGNGHNGGQPKRNGWKPLPVWGIPEGTLSPFAGREPSEEDAIAIRTHMRAFEMASGAGGRTVRRGGPVVGTRKLPRRK